MIVQVKTKNGTPATWDDDEGKWTSPDTDLADMLNKAAEKVQMEYELSGNYLPSLGEASANVFGELLEVFEPTGDEPGPDGPE